MSQNGKKPIAQKPASAPIISSDELFGNPMAIPPEVKKELDQKGLEARWIDAGALYENMGYHDKGWIPFKSSHKPNDGLTFANGRDPEGIIRRGTMILAAKTKENAEKHRAFLRQQAELVSPKKTQARHADGLRRHASQNNLDTMDIEEGYEEDK